MPPNVSEKDCDERHEGIQRRFRFSDWLTMALITIMMLLFPVAGWLGYASLTAAEEAEEAACQIGEHVASNEAESKAIARMLLSMESRQIEMSKRIDGIYVKLGE